jgi:dienelactone hydrolase
MTVEGVADFTLRPFVHEGESRDVYWLGEGPAVVVMAEIPGITPDVAAFARRVVDLGCTAVLPSLFGTPGRAPSIGYGLRSIVPACVAKEFAAFATGRTSPVIGWLRALARHAHAECGGPGVGAVGMCFTGGFALGMMVDDHLLAPVLSQPSLPIAVTKKQRADVGLSPSDLERVKERVGEGVCVLGLRFTGDRLVPRERFETLRRELGDGFVAVEIDSSPGNPHGIRRAAHSVLTDELVDEPGHPTYEALTRVLDLFRTRLLDG